MSRDHSKTGFKKVWISTYSNSHCISGITIIKLQANDGSTGGVNDVSSSGTSGGGQYLNIYSDWEQPQGSGGVSTGYFLENLSQSCLSLELVILFNPSVKTKDFKLVN